MKKSLLIWRQSEGKEEYKVSGEYEGALSNDVISEVSKRMGLVIEKKQDRRVR